MDDYLARKAAGLVTVVSANGAPALRVSRFNDYGVQAVAEESAIDPDAVLTSLLALERRRLDEEALLADIQVLLAADPASLRDQVVAATQRRIDAHARALRERATAGVHPAEMASWPLKRAEALAYAGDPAACPMLAAEAAARGVTLEAIVARVLANATALSHLEAAIAGVAGRHRDAVQAASDPAGYDWSTGWPMI